MNQIDTVLIVDDDPIARAIYQSHLTNAGVRSVQEAASGREAVQMLAQMPGGPQLLILDLNMPEMDGIEMLKHLHHIGYAGRLVIGSASHRANQQSALKLAEIYGLNLIGFISKPLTKRKLDEALPSPQEQPMGQLTG